MVITAQREASEFSDLEDNKLETTKREGTKREKYSTVNTHWEWRLREGWRRQ